MTARFYTTIISSTIYYILKINILYNINELILIRITLFVLGVKGAQVEELWSLDDEQFDNLK